MKRSMLLAMGLLFIVTALHFAPRLYSAAAAGAAVDALSGDDISGDWVHTSKEYTVKVAHPIDPVTGHTDITRVQITETKINWGVIDGSDDNKVRTMNTLTDSIRNTIMPFDEFKKEYRRSLTYNPLTKPATDAAENWIDGMGGVLGGM